MSTPRTKPPRRYKAKKPSAREETYKPGISDENIAWGVGQLITIWPHVEEAMIGLFAELLDMQDNLSARLIFRSIINQNTRLTIMRNLLERSPRHQDKGRFFDDAIIEFESLNSIRNKYAHSLWYTDESTKRVYMEEKTDSYDRFLERREVHLPEITEILRRMRTLAGHLTTRVWARFFADALKASPQTHPPQPPDKTP